MTLVSSVGRSALALSVLALIAGCSTLPRDGPSGRAVERGATTAEGVGAYQIVDLDYGLSEVIRMGPPPSRGSLAGAGVDTPTGLIGPGDSLSVSIFEPSGALFGGGTSLGSVRGGNQQISGIPVGSNGAVGIPYAGQVQVAGLTEAEASQAIRRALIGRVGNPQVVVAIADNAFNTVNVLGEVRQPGRAPLSSNAGRVLDVIAARGGTARAVEDVLVVVQRGDQTFSAPLSAVSANFSENIRLARGDQLNLVYQPRKFRTFGALSAVADVTMEPGETTLAGALSRVGGLNTNIANARSVLVFRLERPEIARAVGATQPPSPRGVPIVYRLNLEDAAGFFTAGNFIVQPEDIVYVPNSGSAELSKFFTLVQSVTRVVYDVSVTSALNLD